MYDYAIRFEQEEDVPGLAVFCRDLPELNSYGEDLNHAISQADDAIATTLSLYVDQRRSIPKATSPEDGEHVVPSSAVVVAKIVLWNAMMERDMRKADLCRLLGVHQAQGDRLVDFLHTSKMEQLEAALKHLGISSRAPFEQVMLYYVPFIEARDYDLQTAWIHRYSSVTTEMYDEITYKTLLPENASQALKESLARVSREKFGCHLYRRCPIGGKTDDMFDEGGILFNFKSMPAGMIHGPRWVDITPSELAAVDMHAYRSLIGLEAPRDARS